ncbi:MAG TPA: N-acetylmuramidase domain-containing protein [Blastocatellia bacterium]|nr:N-acetylmuramidase domain-containing protein [Blastocatellia bacterium]
MSTRTGTTTTDLRMRSGPGTQFGIITLLKPKTNLAILDEQGEWLRVKAANKEGFVNRNFVSLSEEHLDPGFMITNPPTVTPAPTPSPGTVTPAAADVSILDIPLEPPASQTINLGAQATGNQKLVAGIWNRLGGLLGSLAKELKFEPGVAVAVFGVESGGKSFGPDGRMIIRFENHKFFQHWGKANPDTFKKFFTFNKDKVWLGHQWRPAPNKPFQDFHGKQTGEWTVFNFAATLDDTAAKLSISMGGPQIMGSNYPLIGYESVQQMFDAFSTGERHQVIGFFDFVQGPNTISRPIQALQRQDFDAFAGFYNGTGKAAEYGAKIRSLFETFQKISPI